MAHRDRAEGDDRSEDVAEEEEPDSGDGKSAPSKTAEIKPLVAHGRLSGGDLHARGPATDTADIKADEAPSLGLTAGPRMTVSEAAPTPARDGGGVRLAILSV